MKSLKFLEVCKVSHPKKTQTNKYWRTKTVNEKCFLRMHSVNVNPMKPEIQEQGIHKWDYYSTENTVFLYYKYSPLNFVYINKKWVFGESY
jgi:hypothetical protein